MTPFRRKAGTNTSADAPPGSKGGLPLRLLVVILIVILLVGAFPTWPHSATWGYAPSGGLGLVLIVLLVLALLGHL